MLTSNGDRDTHHAKRKSATRRSNPDKPNGETRRIPERTRDAVFERDKGRCTYIGATGRQCRSTYRLHVDHILPFARGGTNAATNLRLLCAKHNNLEAKRVFGSTKIEARSRRE
jgi:5-methylcytosine-specific restriction endonuclease McrA